MWFVCRLLHYNLQEAKRIVASPAPAITRFAEEQSPEQRDHIFDELNTLAVIYRKPSSSFTNAVPAHKEVTLSDCHSKTSCFEALPNQFCYAVGSVAGYTAMLVDRYHKSTGICITWHPNGSCCLQRFLHCCLQSCQPTSTGTLYLHLILFYNSVHLRNSCWPVAATLPV